MPQDNIDIRILLLIIILCVIIIIPMVIGFAIFLNNFSAELKYLNCEISRTRGTEQKQWIYQRRRLLLSLIPFVKY